MIDLLERNIDITPKSKRGGSARRKSETRQKASKALYKPHRVIYHPPEENA